MPRETRDETREESREGTGRKKRQPVGRVRLKMDAPKRKGFQSRWVNDTPGRIQMFEDGGYEKRKDMEPKLVGTAEGGGPLYAYLMDIPEEWYDEDQVAKQAEIDRIDATISGGRPHGAGSDENAFYDAGTKVSTSKR